MGASVLVLSPATRPVPSPVPRPKLVASPGTAGFLPDRPSRIIARMTQTTTTAPPTPPRRPSRRRDAVETVLLAVIAYVPFLAVLSDS